MIRPGTERLRPGVAVFLAFFSLGTPPAAAELSAMPSPQERQPNERLHPMEEALLSNSAGAPVREVAFRRLESALPARLSVLARFPADHAIGRLGLTEDDTTQVLGKIVDAILLGGIVEERAALAPEAQSQPARSDAARTNPGSGLAQPDLVLLDQSYTMARIFGADGTPLSRFGGKGEGPGELTSPVALASAGGDVLILDAAMKVERYGWSGTEWEPTRRLQLPMDAQDLCPLDDGLAVIGMRVGEDGMLGSSGDPRAVHILSYDDQEVTASFSAPYHYEGVMALWYMMRGKLACDPARRVVWAAYEYLHEIHALDQEGNLLWITRLADVPTTYMVEMRGGAAVGGRPQEGVPVEMISDITLLDDDLLAVQVTSALFERNTEGAPPTRTVSYRTYLLDPDTGEGVGAFRADHQVIGGGNGRAVLYREDPFPQVAVVRVGEG